MSSIEVVSSVISPAAIAELVEREYDFGTPVRSTLLSVNDNDSYLVQAGERQFVFRVYQLNKHWRSTESEHRFELEWLAFLAANRMPVSYPIKRRNDDYLGRLPAPEGRRYCALFSFAEGQAVFPLSRAQSAILGAHMAEIHLVSEKFVTQQSRHQLDLNSLLETPVERIRAFLGSARPLYEKTLLVLAEQLRARLCRLPVTPELYGIIGGDFHWGNNHFTADDRITFFDFDLCGYGWRAYDLAVFLWSAHIHSAPAEMREGLLEGYQSVRRLTPEELEALPFLMVARQIWLTGSHTTYATQKGIAWFDEHYWKLKFETLRSLSDAAQLTEPAS